MVDGLESAVGVRNALAQAVDVVGSQSRAAQICAISNNAMSKMVKRGCLPRTEYTGETCYAALLAAASGGRFTAGWLLEHARPKRLALEDEAGASGSELMVSELAEGAR